MSRHVPAAGQMVHSPEQEMELVEEIISYANDPRGFVQFCYPWGEEGTRLARVREPYDWQIETLEWLRDHAMSQEFALENGLPLQVYQEAVASGRGIGKSALFAMIANWMTSCHIGANVIVTANTEGQLRSKTFPEFKEWYAMAINRHWWELEALRIVPRGWLAALVEQQLRQGTGYWNVIGLPWSEENPDAFAGAHNSVGQAVLFDEASGIPAPIWNVTEGFFSDPTPYRAWIAFSQLRRNEGRFYDLFYNPRFAPFWHTRQIDARTVPSTDRAKFEQMVAIHGEDSDVVRMEVRGLPPSASDDQFIPVDVFDGARDRPEPAEAEEADWLIMGVDPAPRGRTVIRFRQGRDGRSIPRVVLNGKDNIAIAKTIMQLANKYALDAQGYELLGAVVIDAGLGTGVIDYLKEKKFHRAFRLYSVLFGAKAEDPEWGTMGTNLWARMRKWMESITQGGGHGRIDGAEEFRRDCIVRRWKWFGREDKQKILESKKDLEKRGIDSSDDADSFALTFYPKLPPRGLMMRRHDAGVVPVAKGVGCDVI